MTQPTKITIDDTVYVREDSIRPEATLRDTDGLEYVVVRSRDQGVMAGYLVETEAGTATLKQARQLWRWDSNFVLADLATTGVRKPEACKFSAPMSHPMAIYGVCGIYWCSQTAAQSIQAIKAQG